MAENYRRHDISDRVWELLRPHLPGRQCRSGRNAKDNRQFINAVIWILRTGAPWRDKGIWEKLFKLFVQDPDFEWLMIDASYIKVHLHAAGAVGCAQDMERTKGGSTPRFTLQ